MDDNQLLRYSRHIMLPEIDIDGQERLLAAHVLVLGLGGLGCPVAMYLAAAGVGTLTLVDDDHVDLSNLQRQIAHTTSRIGELKTESARVAVAELNPDVTVHTCSTRLDEAGLTERLAGVDVVVDATDNFTTRFALNRIALERQIPVVSGAAIRLEGQVAVFDHRDPEAPCYACLYGGASDGDLNCAENGVAAPVVGIIGTMQALETLKLIVGTGETLAGQLLTFDAKYADWQKLRLPKNPDCPACSG